MSGNGDGGCLLKIGCLLAFLIFGPPMIGSLFGTNGYFLGTLLGCGIAAAIGIVVVKVCLGFIDWFS